MFKKFILASSLLIAAGCTTVPITGRRQLSLVSDSEMLTLSNQEYQKTLSISKLSTNASQTAMVKRVGLRIQHAVEEYMAQTNNTAALAGYQWEFNLVEDKQVNAWCMPGGKVVVYTGILPITQDENGLAVVLGHEISHAVAKHGSERMSDQLVAQYGGAALQTVTGGNPSVAGSMLMTAVGAGSQLGLLHFSRQQESEADHLGLIFMAMAGYNPETAVAFWQRMAAQSQGGTPAFLSDHPADQQRIADIQRLMPEAQKYYKPR
ncbi:M48 family metallopeptidase [Hymenobacter sp. GOD-10R]|uniref:M48 family metallopeptidase n=1 Tax=Hymenobacter sp. GOD-10R TaxID=3093922 RepID=UPI002D767A58|nr:M48 family metallopeptidase [Hymenobacter sp. GOD-10R]WRQ30521.1 M48 family metallopeptidase [Hymenobacter sp. GOD-10R]